MAATVSVKVLSLAGEVICTLPAESSATIHGLKAQIADVRGTPVELQSLILEDHALEDKRTLAELGWHEAVEVYLVERGIDFEGHLQQLRPGVGGVRGASLPLPAEELQVVCAKARAAFLREPMLLELEAPLTVCGTLTGCQVGLLSKLFSRFGDPGQTRYLFLGNYVNRAKYMIETITTLFLYKGELPAHVFMLRGKNDSLMLSRIYGFYDEVKRRMGGSGGVKLWKHYTEVFDCMPVCALIQSKIFCVASGLSPDLTSLDQIRDLPRQEVPDEGLLCDLLWSTFEPHVLGWGCKDKDVSFNFGPDIVSGFLEKHGLQSICCSSGVVEAGYQIELDGALTILFSAADYVGEYGNLGAVLLIDQDLQQTCVQYASTD
ncbi:sds21 [Symbiodinium natans]|uniref:protein-serine/threonine phosphatase n=1 Tax=Symbiodinium natans TaxID=878477 RepID=A0A812KXM2_9DINO|nr:sds21 [Symbiodinium natans]